MKIIFMGTPEIAVPSLEALINSRHEVICVITRPDQKSGRGMSMRYSPVKETALRHGIDVFQPPEIDDPKILDELEAMGADIFAVAAYSRKIPDRLLNMARFGCINMHPSLLPKYRGSGPLRGPILNGDKETGVTIIRLSSRWDAGDMLMQESFLMDEQETSATLEEKTAILGARLMLATIDGLEEGTVTPVAQDDSKATYLKQIKKEEGIIDFSDSAVNIERKVRALNPWPSAYTYLNGKTFKIWDAYVLPENFACAAPSDVPDDLPFGAVAYKEKKSFLIKTGDGFLAPRIVQPEGKKRMSADEFLRGYKVEQGLIFGK